MTNEAGRSNRRPNVIMTLVLLVGTVGFMAIYFGLYRLLGVDMPYFGLLFLVYWAAILQQKLEMYFPAVLGSLTGILLGWIAVVVPSLVGSAGLLVSAGAVAAVLFCFMRGHANLIVNNATMLFVTVATIPDVHIANNAVTMVKSLLLGAIYMGAVTLAVSFLQRAWSARSGLDVS